LKDQLKDAKDELETVKDKLNKCCTGQGSATGVAGTVNFSRVEFDLGRAAVKSAYYPSLDGLVNLLRQYPDWNLLLKGYADSTGSASANLKLSQDRANAVKNYLVGKGAQANKIQAEGFGQANPIGDNKTAAGRAMNRRVEIELQTR